jgi:hypothetical protein
MFTKGPWNLREDILAMMVREQDFKDIGEKEPGLAWMGEKFNYPILEVFDECEGGKVCDIYNHSKTMEANAHLISACPEMYEWMEAWGGSNNDVSEYLESHGWIFEDEWKKKTGPSLRGHFLDEAMRTEAKSILAKARGE